MSLAALWVAFGTDGNVICTNECDTKGNGVCDDGGPNSDFGTCDLGTDCEDCGPRESTIGRCEDDPSWTDIEHGNGEHSCKDFAHQRFWCTDFGTYSEAAMLACPVSCGLCSQSLTGCECAGVDNHMGVGSKCTPDHLYGGLQWCYVDLGDCPNALLSELKSIQEQNLGFIYCGDVDFSDEECNDTCFFADDGRCDDGGAGSVSAACELGSDCKDCGPRPGGGSGPESTEVITTYYPTLGSCISHSGGELGSESQSMLFPATVESDTLCIELGEDSEQVICEGLGEITVIPYTGGTQCGSSGGKPQKEKKWTHLFQQICYESEYDGEKAFARKDWEGRCYNPDIIDQACHLQEGKLKMKKAIESDVMKNLENSCLCAIHCTATFDPEGKPWSHFTWAEKNGDCQCFSGKFKKYKEKSGFFSGPL